MAYIKQFPEGYAGPKPLSETYCFVCGKRLVKNKPVVFYDGNTDHAIEKYKISGVAILMHPSCANAMAQRLITDTWVKRREWGSELINLK